MIREIVLDTETTGLDPASGHRIVEIGAVELVNHIPSGRTFHSYINPDRDMPDDALAIHGLTREFLGGHPMFSGIVEELESFLCADRLIIHNASFDIAFLDWELRLLGRPCIAPTRILDTLALARQRHPSAPNSLDALCRRYGIDNTRRTRHGALLDAELLAEVYLELVGGRQASLVLTTAAVAGASQAIAMTRRLERAIPLPMRLSSDEIAAHAAMVETLGASALWRSYGMDRPVG